MIDTPEQERRAVCRECGSIRTRAGSGNVVRRLLATVRGRIFVHCERCGWKGSVRRAHTSPGRESRRVARTHADVPLGGLDSRMADLDRTSEARPERELRLEDLD